DAAEQIYQAAQSKKVIAVTDGMMASAAYWLGSSASEIVASSGSQVGSIGVMMTHVDYSAMNERVGYRVTYIYAGKYKVEGNPDEPLSDETRQYLQSRVDEDYAEFVKSVARGRGVSASTVRSEYGQ